MRRLAVTAAIGLIALAQLGIEQFSSGASADSAGAARRMRATTLDHARSSLPLPRTVAVAPVDEARLRASRAAAARASRSSSASARPSGPWAALAACESGGNPRARSASGLYFGAFQFSVATWRSLGYGGNPADHSYGTQLEAAKRLQARSGWGQWPRCARRLGLL
jgi:hypothetical protein